MVSFKTKKLPKKVREVSTERGGGTLSEEDKIPKKKMHISSRLLIGILISFVSIFFITTLALRALQGNERNGSEVFRTQKIIPEEYIKQKVTGTTNILIAWIGGKWHDGADLTDSIMLASLDSERHTVTLLSIPRDLYVAYPKGKWSGKINSLYDIWKRDSVGITYLADKVSEITWQVIDHYMVIDFTGFKDIINILGWVSIDVPMDLVDREYPDENWWYTTFSVKKWIQILDGDTALKYARSRHSTSDFDRSSRQQLIIKWVKEKASDLGIITSPGKIAEVYKSIISHLDTDLSIAGMADIALAFSSIQGEDIDIVSLSDYCLSLLKCVPGSYLYAPSRDLFGWSAVVIPENAQSNKLSYYIDIQRFVDLTFRFPGLRESPRDIVIVTDPTMRKRGQELGMGLAKLGFPLSIEKTLTVSSGAIEKSHVNIYWNSSLSVGIDPSSPPIEALKYLEEWLPYVIVEQNEYITTSGPKIEIVIWKDGGSYLKDIKFVYYIPAPPKSTTSWESPLAGWGTGEKSVKWTIKTWKDTKQVSVSWETSIQLWQWENF